MGKHKIKIGGGEGITNWQKFKGNACNTVVKGFEAKVKKKL